MTKKKTKKEKSKYKVIKIVRPDIFNTKVEVEHVERNRKISKAKETLQSAYKKFMKKKILKKPTAKIPSYSAKKFVSSLASNRNEMVRDVENPYANPEQDNRSLFFKESFKEEKRKAFGGFI